MLAWSYASASGVSRGSVAGVVVEMAFIAAILMSMAVLVRWIDLSRSLSEEGPSVKGSNWLSVGTGGVTISYGMESSSVLVRRLRVIGVKGWSSTVGGVRRAIPVSCDSSGGGGLVDLSS